MRFGGQRFLKVANVVAFMLCMITNALADLIPIGGRTAVEVSARYTHLLVPAAYSFAIWGVIYLLLALFTVYQAWGMARPTPGSQEAASVIGWAFVVASVANAAWVVAWHYEALVLTVLTTLVLLSALVVIYLRLGRAGGDRGPSWHYLVVLPFSVYLSWVVVATPVSLGSLMIYLGLDEVGAIAAAFAIAMMILIGSIGVYVLMGRGDVPYALTTLWALTAVLAARRADATETSTVVAIVAGVVSVVMALAVVIPLILSPGSSIQRSSRVCTR